MIFLPSESEMTILTQRQVALKMPELGNHLPKQDFQLQQVQKKDQLFSLDKNPLDVFRTPWWDTTKKPSALNLKKPSENTSELNWLVFSTHLNNISQFGSFPQVGVEIKNV